MIITTKAVTQKKTNEKDWPAEYSCNFLEPGLVSYEDVGAGIAFLPKETILKMLQSFVGKPVVIDHVDVTPKDFKDHAVGYITKVWYDDYANWAKCSFLLTDDKAKEKVARGYSVSCAYDQVVTGPGGEKNAIHFHETILDGVGNHLALVTSPRYEEAKIHPTMMLVNSKRATITRENTVVVKVAKQNTVTVKVVKNAGRICDTCEYLKNNMCAAVKEGKISQAYADKRLDGTEPKCSAYEKE